MSRKFEIGEWVFDPAIGTLSRNGKIERLENRASRLLDILCRKGAELVSHSEIIETVWDGRTVSPNSIAVVIGNIRKVLGDSAKSPTYIETVPKRGYRLLAEAAPLHDDLSALLIDETSKSASKIRLGIGFLAVIFIVACITIFALVDSNRNSFHDQAPIELAVTAVENATGDAVYAPLTAAYTDLILNDLVRANGITIVGRENTEFQVKTQIILWDDHPAMSIILTDEDETILWSGMAPGPQSKLAGQVQSQLRQMVKSIRNQTIRPEVSP